MRKKVTDTTITRTVTTEYSNPEYELDTYVHSVDIEPAISLVYGSDRYFDSRIGATVKLELGGGTRLRVDGYEGHAVSRALTSGRGPLHKKVTITIEDA